MHGKGVNTDIGREGAENAFIFVAVFGLDVNETSDQRCGAVHDSAVMVDALRSGRPLHYGPRLLAHLRRLSVRHTEGEKLWVKHMSTPAMVT
jgi:hypothetical protein